MSANPKWQAPADLDPECLELCQAINDCVPGVATVQSCCGHDRHQYMVSVEPETPEALLPLLFALDACHSGVPGWQMRVYTDCGMGGPFWIIEGPQNDTAGAVKIASLVRRTAAGAEAEHTAY